MKADAVFLDSGIFIAFLDRSDRFHAAAVELFSNPPRRCHTSLAVVSETYGWFLHRLGEEAARTFRLALADFRWLTLQALDAAHHAAVLGKLGVPRRAGVGPALQGLSGTGTGSLGTRAG